MSIGTLPKLQCDRRGLEIREPVARPCGSCPAQPVAAAKPPLCQYGQTESVGDGITQWEALDLLTARTMSLRGVMLVVIRTVARWEPQGQGWRLTRRVGSLSWEGGLRVYVARV